MFTFSPVHYYRYFVISWILEIKALKSGKWNINQITVVFSYLVLQTENIQVSDDENMFETGVTKDNFILDFERLYFIDFTSILKI